MGQGVDVRSVEAAPLSPPAPPPPALGDGVVVDGGSAGGGGVVAVVSATVGVVADLHRRACPIQTFFVFRSLYCTHKARGKRQTGNGRCY